MTATSPQPSANSLGICWSQSIPVQSFSDNFYIPQSFQSSLVILCCLGDL